MALYALYEQCRSPIPLSAMGGSVLWELDPAKLDFKLRAYGIPADLWGEVDERVTIIADEAQAADKDATFDERDLAALTVAE